MAGLCCASPKPEETTSYFNMIPATARPRAGQDRPPGGKFFRVPRPLEAGSKPIPLVPAAAGTRFFGPILFGPDLFGPGLFGQAWIPASAGMSGVRCEVLANR